MKIVIVGNSAAALAALESIRRASTVVSITMVAEESALAYSRPALSKVISGSIDRDRLFIRDSSYYCKMNLELLLGQSVTRVIPSENVLLIGDDRSIAYDRLLIAWGGRASVPQIPGLEDCRGPVFRFRTLADLDVLLAWLEPERRTVLLIGGGFINVSLADALIEAGHRPIIVELCEHLLPRMVDARIGQKLRGYFESRGASVFTGVRVTSLSEAKPGFTCLIGDGLELLADGAVVGTGVSPLLEPVYDTPVKVSNGIIVDSHLRSSVENIYAAGDVAEAPTVAGGQEVCPIWPTAVEQGRIAGLNMLGLHREYRGSVQLNSLSLAGGLVIVSFGLTQPGPDDSEEILMADDSNYAKVVLNREGAIQGYSGYGRFPCAYSGAYMALARKGCQIRGGLGRRFGQAVLSHTCVQA